MENPIIKCENCGRVFDGRVEFIVFRFNRDFCSVECSEKWFDSGKMPASELL